MADELARTRIAQDYGVHFTDDEWAGMQRENVPVLPDCMMPDGADPCAGFRQLHDRIEVLEMNQRRLLDLVKWLFDNPDATPEQRDQALIMTEVTTSIEMQTRGLQVKGTET